jgi:hypothetical protein
MPAGIGFTSIWVPAFPAGEGLFIIGVPADARVGGVLRRISIFSTSFLLVITTSTYYMQSDGSLFFRHWKAA